MDFTDIQGWVGLAKNSVELMKSAASLLPRGEKRAEIEGKITVAEEALKRSDVKLARDLGLKLCDCTFPPQIMLWREAEKSHICPNPACGRKTRRGMNITKEMLEQAAKPGPRSWMAR
jgi:hypothetical protein